MCYMHLLYTVYYSSVVWNLISLPCGSASAFLQEIRVVETKQKPQEAYAASLWGGSIGGIAVGILMVVLVSLPLCCGILKQYGKANGPAIPKQLFRRQRGELIDSCRKFHTRTARLRVGFLVKQHCLSFRSFL